MIRRALAPLRQVQQMVPRLASKLTLFVLTSFGAAFAEAVMLLLIAQIAAAVTADRSTVALVLGLTTSTARAFTLTAVAVIVRLVLGLAYAWVSASFSTSVLLHARRTVIEAQVTRTWEQESDQQLGTDQDLLATASHRVASWAGALGQVALASISVAVLTIASISTNLLAFFAMAGAGLVIVGLRPLTRRTKRWSSGFATLNQQLVEKVADRAGAAFEIRAFAVSDPVAQELLSLNRRSGRTYLRTRLATGASPQLFQAATLLTLLATMAVVSMTTSASSSSLGAVALLMLRSLSYGQQLATGLQALAESGPYVDQLTNATSKAPNRSFPSQAPGITSHADGAHLPSPQRGADRTIRFDDVSFSYRSDRPVLRHCSFDIGPGEMLGIVGSSGAGKSTLVQLLLGLRAPDSGTIWLGDTDRATIPRAVWAPEIAFVAQEPRLIAGTVAENIAFFRPLPRDAIIEAARKALIDEDIASWPDGYDTEVGERGRQVSGGQRQRLAIARALVAHPSLLVMDEPTSSLDPQSESSIVDLLRRLRGEVTIVIITHRQSTAERCDRLLRLEHGHLNCASHFGSSRSAPSANEPRGASALDPVGEH